MIQLAVVQGSGILVRFLSLQWLMTATFLSVGLLPAADNVVELSRDKSFEVINDRVSLSVSYSYNQGAVRMAVMPMGEQFVSGIIIAAIPKSSVTVRFDADGELLGVVSRGQIPFNMDRIVNKKGMLGYLLRIKVIDAFGLDDEHAVDELLFSNLTSDSVKSILYPVVLDGVP